MENRVIIKHLEQLCEIKKYYLKEPEADIFEDPLTIKDINEIEQHLNMAAISMGTIAGRILTSEHFFEEKQEGGTNG